MFVLLLCALHTPGNVLLIPLRFKISIIIMGIWLNNNNVVSIKHYYMYTSNLDHLYSLYPSAVPLMVLNTLVIVYELILG